MKSAITGTVKQAAFPDLRKQGSVLLLDLNGTLQLRAKHVLCPHPLGSGVQRCACDALGAKGAYPLFANR
jgi:hypothetical protein